MTHEQVPQSFFDRPCQRCKRREEAGKPTTVRYDEERGLFLCLCFWHPEMRYHDVPEQPKVIEPKLIDFWIRSKKVS